MEITGGAAQLIPPECDRPRSQQRPYTWAHPPRLRRPRIRLSLRRGEGRTPLFRGHTQPIIRVPESGATPWPLFGRNGQLCLRRIILNVSTRTHFVFSIAHVGIPITILPKLPFATEQFVCFLGGKALPSFHQFRHRHILDEEKQMHMVWHHHPCPQAILHPLSKQQRAFNHHCNIWTAKMALASAKIEIRFKFNPSLPIVLNLQ